MSRAAHPPASNPRRPRHRLRSFTFTFTLAMSLAGCVHHPPPPTPGTPPPAPHPIQLAGLPVMVLPAQADPSVPTSVAAAFDAELAYWLGERAPRVRWIPEERVLRLVQSSPGLHIDLQALDVRQFQRMKVQQIGDPLFGDLHNLGAVLDARLALLPVGVAYVLPRDSAGHALSGPGHLEVSAALIETFGGEVRWYAVVSGEPGPIDAPATAASAARALAAALLPPS